MVDAAGAIRQTEPLRHDALATERTGVLKDNCAIPLIVSVEGDPIADATKEIGERSLAVLDRSPRRYSPSSSIRSKAQSTAA
jgi:hypothetical protein